MKPCWNVNGLMFLPLLCMFAVPARAVPEGAKAPQSGEELLQEDVTQGALRLVGAKGNVIECPLKHTDVKADIAGFIARVRVVQTFHNPTNEKIEAVYVFPLPHEAAVDEMTMVIGPRRIVGLIKRRAEAREIYERALLAGQTAALLEQERPNIFTQSVGNIEPGAEVRIEISYVDVLKYDVGTYEFHFPVVVGPRYNPGTPTSVPPPTPFELRDKTSAVEPNTTRVPDASRITPPFMKPQFRNGHDISLALTLDAGVPIQDLKVANHKADVDQPAKSRAAVKLSPADSIPNKDFILRYSVVGKKPEMAVLGHRTRQGQDPGYFMLMIQPKEDERLSKSPPREIVFLVDVSGSMSGEPTAKNIEIMQKMLGLCRGQDTVQVITFESSSRKLFDAPVPVNPQNIQRALRFTEGLQGGGGTEMLKGIQMAIDEPVDKQRVRIVVMLTDGYIGNEAEIIKYVGEHCNDQVRFWCVGIGQAPNMFLVDGVAKQGGGMGKKLGLRDDSVGLAQEIMTRIQRAQLAKIRIDWGDLKVSETFPSRIPELWAGRPVIVFGRYLGGDKETVINISGKVEGEDVSWPLTVLLPREQKDHDALAKVWARQKIEDLMQQTYYQGSPAIEEAVTSIALNYRLMSQYTSFVAVDEKEAAKLSEPARPPRRMLVPLPLPEGTRWEGFFGEERRVVTPGPKYAMLDADAPVLMGAGQMGLALGKRMRESTKSLASTAGARMQFAPQDGLGRMGSYGGRAYGAYGRSGLGSGGYGGGYGGGGYGGYAGLAAANAPTALPPSVGAASAAPASTTPFSRRGVVNGELGQMNAAAVSRKAEAAKVDIGGWNAWSFTASAVSQAAIPASQAAQESLKAGQDLRKAGNKSAARDAFVRAYYLDTAAANVGASPGQTAAAAMAAIEELRAEQVREWAKSMPALDNKLDLVIRDKSLAEALTEVAPGAGLIPGSIEDVTDLLARREVRVSFLDLRGATRSQALDWLLRPVRMTWWVDGGKIVAGTDRRRAGTSAWVYDVSIMAMPSEKEMTGKDGNELMAAAKTQADDFLKVVTGALKLTDKFGVSWFGPGQVLVIGDAAIHEAAARLLTALADPNAKLPGDAAVLQKITSKRATERKAAYASALEERAAAEVWNAHQVYGWRLLAAAADGRLDLEALAELQIAWKSPFTADLLKKDGPALALRTAWMVKESALALPQETELGAFAAAVVQQSRPALTAALAALEKNPEDMASATAVLYGALANRQDETIRASALAAITKAKSAAGSPLASVQVLAASLLGTSKPADQKALADLVASKPRGEDMVVLTALACRRAGDDAWGAFRAASKELIGEQPLPGAVVLIVNRLGAASLALAKL